jgi:hypothetical protein
MRGRRKRPSDVVRPRRTQKRCFGGSTDQLRTGHDHSIVTGVLRSVDGYRDGADVVGDALAVGANVVVAICRW